MGKHAQIVVGPAGSGKSTYCSTIAKHCEATKRPVSIVNLDPAAETFDYDVSIDIRDLISLEEATHEMGLGPNGGLVYCMEYLVENIDWLEEKIDNFTDDYLIFDCPGQIELYTHLPVMRILINHLRRIGYNMCAIYMMDSILITDATRFIAGTMMCLSVMAQLEIPHISVMSKCDLVKDQSSIDRFLEPDTDALMAALDEDSHKGLGPLNRAFASLIEEYSMVSFVPLNITDEESVQALVLTIDMTTQYGEDLEPKEPQADADEAGGGVSQDVDA